MARILVIYYSKGGNTKTMAQAIAQGIEQEKVEVVIKDVKDVKTKELLEFQGIVIGSPTYYGTLAAQVKRLLDESVSFHGKLDGKVGAAFASSANVGGGNETTVLSILQAMLIHGMIVQGDYSGDHYGAVGISNPDERSLKQCRRQGKRIAGLVKQLFSK
ncbi:MAG: NAD(P)H-dependent oxidoreductase [Candidatus Gygaella obscura]|nr:NAD(P)H-dependent oxidoreductase [Candidatus Gygaella obscura]